MSLLTKRMRGFTQIPNTLINDTAVSFKAKGLYAYMASKPDSWGFSIAGICSQTKEGKDSIRAGLQELETAGYLERGQSKKKDGTFDGYDYVITDEPNLSYIKPDDGLTVDGKSDDGESNTSNTIYSNTELSNIINIKENNLKEKKIEKFDEFWEKYPKKVGKESARKSYQTALKKINHESLIEALSQRLPEIVAKESQFRPNPSTWLNQGRWQDEVVSASTPTTNQFKKPEGGRVYPVCMSQKTDESLKDFDDRVQKQINQGEAVEPKYLKGDKAEWGENKAKWQSLKESLYKYQI